MGYRYYDAMLQRFLNADKISNVGKSKDAANTNLFAYCGNWPVSRKDRYGDIWETVFDLVTLGASVVEVCHNPSDVWAWAGLVGDAVDIIPFVTCVGESIRAAKTVRKSVDTLDDVIDGAKAVYKSADIGSMIRNSTGVYEIVYDSGKNYVGKGGFKRAIQSAAQHSKKGDVVVDKVASIRWKSCSSHVQAFIEEYALQTLRKLNKMETYNKIWSPGKKYYSIMKW